MVFSSNIFLFIFLPLTLAGHFLAPKKLKNGFLLAMSLLFYAWGEPKVVLVMLASILFNWLKVNVGGIFAVYELLPAFIVAIAAIVIFSLLDKEPSKDMQDEFDAAVKHAKEN